MSRAPGATSMAHAPTILPPATPPLPRPIRRVLVRIDRRLRVAAGLKGMGTVFLVIALGAAAGMAADFAWMLPQSVRWTIWGIWVAAGGGGGGGPVGPR